MKAVAFPTKETQRLVARLQEILPQLQKEYGVQSAWIFGSRVRGDETTNSDIDILVEFDDRPLSLLQFVHLENYLSDVLGVEVDLVERDTLKPAIGENILAEAVPL